MKYTEESNQLSDLMHQHNNTTLGLANLKIAMGYKSKELKKLRIAKNIFCVSMFIDCLVVIAIAYIFATKKAGYELGVMLCVLNVCMFSIFISGWWISCRAIRSEKIKIGHGIA